MSAKSIFLDSAAANQQPCRTRCRGQSLCRYACRCQMVRRRSGNATATNSMLRIPLSPRSSAIRSPKTGLCRLVDHLRWIPSAAAAAPCLLAADCGSRSAGDPRESRQGLRCSGRPGFRAASAERWPQPEDANRRIGQQIADEPLVGRRGWRLHRWPRSTSRSPRWQRSCCRCFLDLPFAGCVRARLSSRSGF
jgi:hypothetical protein